jgi:uncharacterized protein Veg
MGRRWGELSRHGETYSWSVFGDVITLTAPDGRQKKTHLGGIAASAAAKILVRELEDEEREQQKKVAKLTGL